MNGNELHATAQFPPRRFALEFCHAPVETSLFHELLRCALLRHAAFFQHYDVIRPGYGPHPVSDHEHCFIAEQMGEGGLNGALIFHIQAGGGLMFIYTNP